MASQTSECAEPQLISLCMSAPLFYERVPAAIEFRLNLGTIKREPIKARKSLCAGEMTAGINVDTGMFEMKVWRKKGTRCVCVCVGRGVRMGGYQEYGYSEMKSDRWRERMYLDAVMIPVGFTAKSLTIAHSFALIY